MKYLGRTENDKDLVTKDYLAKYAKKGEILPSNIKGNTLHKITTYVYLDNDGDLSARYIDDTGKLITNWIYLSRKFVKKDDSKTITDALKTKNTEQDSEITQLKTKVSTIEQSLDGVEALLKNINSKI